MQDSTLNPISVIPRPAYRLPENSKTSMRQVLKLEAVVTKSAVYEFPPDHPR